MVDLQRVETQPEFPEVDLTARSADILSLTLQNRHEVEQNHAAAKLILAYRALHPQLVSDMSDTYEEAHIDAISYGMTIFEAINASVQSINPAEISRQSLTLVTGHPKTVERLIDPLATQEVVDVFVSKLPNTARVVRDASERVFPRHVEYAQAGAALECLVTSQAIRAERGTLIKP